MISSTIQGSQYELVAGHPALDLVNTLDWRFRENGPEELLASYDDLLRFAAQSELLTEKQIRQILRNTTQSAAADALVDCRKLREATADVLYASLDGRNPGAAQLKTLERFFLEARQHQHLVWSKPRLRWNWPANEPAAELPLWILSQGAVRLMTSEDMHRLRVCENPECRWLFLDTSKNHTRRWCDMKVCGNRMKARRFKAQHKA
jgi:predicted RNA-binding Zn ribbon-like protein